MTSIRGGARAVDFDRSGGFTIDSVSKSGTNRFSGLASVQFQHDNVASNLESGSLSRYEQDRTWVNLNVGGPILPDRRLLFVALLACLVPARRAGNLRSVEALREDRGRVLVGRQS